MYHAETNMDDIYLTESLCLSVIYTLLNISTEILISEILVIC